MSPADLARSASLAVLFAAVPPAQDAINASLLAPAPHRARADEPYVPAFARARPAVVHVYVEVQGPNTFRIERPGTGVVVDPDGLVVTWRSLVREVVGATDKTLFVQLPDSAATRFPAQIVADHAPSGLALLKADLPAGTALDALPLVTDARPGDPVAVLAFPDGEDPVGFAGVLTHAVGGVTIGAGGDPRSLERGEILLTGAAIQRRCHGAALLDAAGALVGICNAEHVRLETAEPTLEDLKRPSFGFAIPARAIRAAFADALGKVPTAPRVAPAGGPAAAVARVAPAIVAVYGGAIAERPPLGLRDPYARRRRPGVGSGVVVDTTGLVLTDRHLVAGADEVTVTLRGGESYSAEVLKSDPRTNSALLKMDLPADQSVAAIRCGSARSAAPGDPLLAVGNPEGHTLTISAGVLSARRGEALQTDTAIGNQNGGGALVTLRGEMIGLVDAGVRDAIDVAFARRGDRAKVETSLNLVPGIDALRHVYDAEFARHAGRNESLAVPAATSGYEPARIAEIVEQTAGAMLNVYVEITSAPAQLEDNPFAKPEPRTMVRGLGSGVIIDPSGLALTNWHVVDSATLPSGAAREDHVVRAALRNGRVFEVEVLSISREEDLALVQLELEPGETVDAVELGDSGALAVGDRAIAIGNPHGRANTVTAGIVSAKNQAIRVRGRWAKLPHLLETDAAINAGNSGGALLDLGGRLIGINSAGGAAHQVTGYAISVDHVREKLHSVLLTPEKLRSCYVGLTVVDRGRDGQSSGLVVVQSVDPLGPAARAGIETGDVISSVDGDAVRWSVGYAMTLRQKGALQQSGASRPLTFTLQRSGERLQKTLRPLSAAAWAVFRQVGLATEELSFRDDGDTVRQASLAFYRRFTGDPTAAPGSIPECLVRVVRVHPRLVTEEVDVRAGDLLLGVQIREEGAAGDTDHLLRFSRVEDVQRCFNEESTYEGREFRTWLYRDGEVRVLDLSARRLMW